MRKYRLSKTVEDEVVAPTHYEAYLLFRQRDHEGYYAIQQKDVEFIEEVEETTTLTPEESST